MRLNRYLPAVAASALGFVGGFATHAALDLGKGTAFVVVAGAIAAAAAADLAAGGLRTTLARAAGLATGRLPGYRRIPPERRLQTRVLPHVAGSEFEHEQWVDLSQLDHRGYFYGVAQSRTYIPLFGNGLVAIPEVEFVERELSVIPGDLAQLFDAKIQQLVSENDRAGRPFSDGPMVRLLHWIPPIDEEGPLKVIWERVGHHRYAAASAILREDAGQFRSRFGVEVRGLSNPAVCGCLGVEVAVVTSDNQLVLAQRGDEAGDYRRQTVVTIGEAMHPDLDWATDHEAAAAVRRGAEEELGIEVDGRRTRFLALGLETQRADPDLLGYVRIDQTSDDVRVAHLAGRARDRWENRNLTFTRFDPEAVADLLVSGQGLTPATPMNLVFALSDAFGEKAVQRAMSR